MSEKCGTHAGYQRHQQWDGRPCVACCDAHATYMAQWRATRPSSTAHETCGSEAGYRRHRDRHDRVCEACRDAMGRVAA